MQSYLYPGSSAINDTYTWGRVVQKLVSCCSGAPGHLVLSCRPKELFAGTLLDGAGGAHKLQDTVKMFQYFNK